MTWRLAPQLSPRCRSGQPPLKHETSLLLKGLQIGDHVIDLRNIKRKLRHSRMTGDGSSPAKECVDVWDSVSRNAGAIVSGLS